MARFGSARISEHFTLGEFLRSETAVRKNIPMDPPADAILSMTRLCVQILEPVRAQFGPLTILSGYRPKALNLLVGGSPRSQHLYGEAADFTVPGATPLEVCRWIETAGLPFDQLIHEFGEWVHVSVPPHGRQPRRDCRTACRHTQSRTVYAPGLVPVEGGRAVV